MLFSCLLQVFCKITIKIKESKTSIAFFVILFLSMAIFPSRTFHAVVRFFPNLFFESFGTQLRSFRIVYSFPLNSRGLVCVQASPRRNANEPSLECKRALAHKVNPLARRKPIKGMIQSIPLQEFVSPLSFWALVFIFPKEPTLTVWSTLNKNGITLFKLLADYLMSIVLVISKNLFNVNHFWTGIPCDTTSYQKPVFTFFYRNSFN